MLKWLHNLFFKKEQKRLDDIIRQAEKDLSEIEKMKNQTRYITLKSYNQADITYIAKLSEIVASPEFLFFMNKFKADREIDFYSSIDNINDISAKINLGIMRAVDLILEELNGMATLHDLEINARENLLNGNAGE